MINRLSGLATLVIEHVSWVRVRRKPDTNASHLKVIKNRPLFDKKEATKRRGSPGGQGHANGDIFLLSRLACSQKSQLFSH